MNKQEAIQKLTNRAFELPVGGVVTGGTYQAVRLTVVEEVIDQLDELEMTEEQVWEAVAKHYPGTAIEIKNAFEHFYYGEVEKAPRWVVPFADEDGETFYFSNFYEDEKGNMLTPNGFPNKKDPHVIKFTDKAKAEAVALLVGGKVEEVTE